MLHFKWTGLLKKLADKAMKKRKTVTLVIWRDMKDENDNWYTLSQPQRKQKCARVCRNLSNFWFYGISKIEYKTVGYNIEENVNQGQKHNTVISWWYLSNLKFTEKSKINKSDVPGLFCC